MPKHTPLVHPRLLRALLPIILAGLFPCGNAEAQSSGEVLMPRYPAPSPDGSRVAFCHQGDIWVVDAEGGEARRLTAHPAYDQRPIWSPDGRWIAFISSRDGNEDIYLVPPAGGDVRRLTWYSGYDNINGWTPDSRALIFQGRRHVREESSAGAFLVPIDGGLPRALMATGARSAVLSPHGDRLLYVRGSVYWWTRGYEGNARYRLWITELPEPIGRPEGWRAPDPPAPPLPAPPQAGRLRWDGPACTSAGLYRDAALFAPDDHLNLTDLASVTEIPGGDPRRGYLATYLAQRPDWSRPEVEVGSNMWPQWFPDNDHLLYWSEYRGYANLKLMSVSTGARAWVTRFREGRLRHPTLSADGSLVAFEYEDGIYTVRLPDLPPPGSATWTAPVPGPQRLEIRLPIETRPVDYARKEVTGGATEFALSPDDEQIALVAFGEIFAMKASEEEPSAYRLTDTAAREEGIAWSPDAASLVFVSDRAGTRDLYRIRSTDEHEPRLARSLHLETERLTDDEQDDTNPVFSPDGERIAFQRGIGDLVVMDADGSNQKVLSPGFSSPSFRWSPDSRWLVFDREDSDFNNDVYIVAADGDSPPHNISQHPDDDYGPYWSADGKRIAFVSRRVFPDQTDIWYVWLTREDEERSREDRLEALLDERAADSRDAAGRDDNEGDDAGNDEHEDEDDGDEDEDEDEDEEEVVEVRIDFEGIHKRLHRLTSFPGPEGSVMISKDGKGYNFTAETDGKRDLWWIEWDGSEPKRVTQGGQSPRQMQYDSKGKRVYYLKGGGTITSVPIQGGDSKSYGYRAQMTIDRIAQRGFVFDEAWRALDAKYYDPDHHGIDWNAMHHKYRPWALGASTYEDYRDVVKLMLGELNSSHLNIYGGPDDWSIETGPASTGDLGVLFDPTYSGPGLRIAHVVEGSPADREESRLLPGEIVRSIAGAPVDLAANPFVQLDATEDRKILLEVENREGDLREVAIRPTSLSEMADLFYKEEVEARRRFVEEHGDGKVAYVHIEAMGTNSFELFERDLYAVAHGKEVLIIDVRGNGGGWTTDLMLTSLLAGDHAVTRPRGGGTGYPHGRRLIYAWTKPIVVLCDEYSFSNAEIFSWAIRTLERGPVVGQRTHGGVISTGGTTLGDGAYLRLPFRGWTSKLDGSNLEGTGCMPDIVVANLPGEMARGLDRQLQRALEEALARLP